MIPNPEKLLGKVVLEPSAGTGNIVDFCKKQGADVIACELNNDLARIIEKKARFLKHDFLSVRADEISHIDAVYMNPPFSADEKHILHAWNIAPDGCEIVALCNHETIENTYTKDRARLASIVNDYGYTEFLGDVFSNADRRTSVNISIIRLFKPAAQNNFDAFFESEEDSPEVQGNGIMEYNAIREIVQRYVNAIKLYDSVIANGIAMNDLIGIFSSVKDLTFVCTVKGKETDKLTFQKELQKKAWNWIFSKMQMDKYMTASLKSDINKFVEQQTKVPFTMRNIYMMFNMVIGTHGQRMQKVLIEVFDSLTQHHHDNRFAVEGWKTNSHYLINRKFIMPYITETNRIFQNEHVSLSWGRGNAERLDDLQKALSYITGTNYNEMEPLYQFYSRNKKVYGQWYTWGFFEIKAFKKGTVHCKFIDDSVWTLFNFKVAEAKGFELPENIRRSA